MRAIIISCRTVENELRLALERTNTQYPVLYMEAGLHLRPDDLRKTLQSMLDRIENVDAVLMSYGFCGKGLMGIHSDRFKIVVPRVHDCISLLIGSAAERNRHGADVYFLTSGWVDQELSLVGEFEKALSRYGEERGMRVFRRAMQHYTKLTTIDTGAYDVSTIAPRVRTVAEKMNWQCDQVPGSIRFFEKLVTGDWDQEFIVLAPGQEITLEDIMSLGGM